MNRIFRELGAIARTFDIRTQAKYLVKMLVRAPKIVASRKLIVAEQGFGGTAVATYYGEKLRLPLGQIDAATASFDPTPVIALAREMLGHDVYLRGFTRVPKADVVLDLGANRGMFGLIAAKVLGASKIIAIEPLDGYRETERLLLEANAIAPQTVDRYVAFAGVEDNADSISIAEAMLRSGVERIGFCKMDIEGGEFPLIAQGDLLHRIDVIAAELHDFAGDPAAVADALAKEGFTARYSDQFDKRVEPGKACFVHAARDASLVAA